MRLPFSLRHYQPEIDFLKNKCQLRLRLQVKSCFVVDAAEHFTVRASHAPDRFLGTSLFEAAEMSPSEQEILLRSLEAGTRFCFLHCRTPWLVFTDWLEETGLLLILALDADPLATEAVLQELAARQFAFVQSVGGQAPDTVEWQNAFALLSEVFELLDLVCEESLAQSPYQIIAELAALLGCRPEREPVSTPTFSNRELS